MLSDDLEVSDGEVSELAGQLIQGNPGADQGCMVMSPAIPPIVSKYAVLMMKPFAVRVVRVLKGGREMA